MFNTNAALYNQLSKSMAQDGMARIMNTDIQHSPYDPITEQRRNALRWEETMNGIVANGNYSPEPIQYLTDVQPNTRSRAYGINPPPLKPTTESFVESFNQSQARNFDPYVEHYDSNPTIYAREREPRRTLFSGNMVYFVTCA